MFTRCLLPAVFLLLSCLAWADDRVVTDEAVGLTFTLPADGWKRNDLSQAGVVVHLYSPPGTMVPRVTLMRYPQVYLRKGLATRAAQVLRAPGVKQVRFEKAEIAGHAGHVFEYTGQGVRTVEYGIQKAEHVTIVQLAAREADWQDEAKAESHAAFFTSVRFTDVPAPEVKLRVDAKTPAEVRAARARAKPKAWPFSIRSHDLRLDLHPEARRLVVRDDFVVEARVDDLTEVDLLCTLVDVKTIMAGDKLLSFRRRNPRVVTVTLDAPLKKGATRALRYEAEAMPFTFSQDQTLVAEIAMLGQVNATSSFSSHVLYYPIDPANDASIRVAISVPKGYTGVSGGSFLGETREGERRVFRYELAERSARLLPAGFAAGRYEQLRGKTPGGLELVVYHPEGKAKEAQQRLDVALETGALFEARMGPLPWNRVAFCHVTPERKEMGVSLPGQVLISEGFFQDVEGVKLRGDALNEPEMMGLLLPADELSHQWNGYATSLPNELAEGVSTFTNLLYVESKAGLAEYRKGMEFCASAYLASSVGVEDVAVADPKLYQSKIYRVVAFCKVPVVLHMLRQRLGDERFFRAWRAAFTTLRGTKIDFDDFERALASEAKVDLRPFFDQWFFQAGHPRLKIEWTCLSDGEQTALVLDIQQAQPGGLFVLEALPIEVTHEGAEPSRLEVDVSDRRQTLRLPVARPVESVIVDPDRTRLLLHAEVTR